MTLDLLLKLMDEAGAHEALITTCSLKRPLMQESALKQQLLLLPLSHDALAVHHRVHKRTSTSDKLHLVHSGDGYRFDCLVVSFSRVSVL